MTAKAGTIFTYRGQAVVLVRWEFGTSTGVATAGVQHTQEQPREVMHVTVGDPHLQVARRGTAEPARDDA